MRVKLLLAYYTTLYGTTSLKSRDLIDPTSGEYAIGVLAGRPLFPNARGLFHKLSKRVVSAIRCTDNLLVYEVCDQDWSVDTGDHRELTILLNEDFYWGSHETR